MPTAVKEDNTSGTMRDMPPRYTWLLNQKNIIINVKVCDFCIIYVTVTSTNSHLHKIYLFGLHLQNDKLIGKISPQEQSFQILSLCFRKLKSQNSSH